MVDVEVEVAMAVPVRSGVQFFGNFVASNVVNAAYFWTLAFPEFFKYASIHPSINM